MNGKTARYDEFADFYEAFAPDLYDDPVSGALLSLVGDLSGLQLLDLACGHGRMARELARRGAHVVGVDISAALLDKARGCEQVDPMGIVYLHADVTSPDTLKGEIFDGAVCSFGLSDIDDLNGAIATVARVLRPSGSFTFSILHPCFSGWEAKGASPSWPPGQGYFAEGWWRSSGPAGGVRTKVGANHRMISTYLNTLAHYGLMIEEVAEPKPPQEWLDVAPSMGPVPIYLIVRCRKQ
ncbi:MAG: class I SAM-dependent methyltransferase [Chloroflexi bacterium]|nr:class I SAM-dependent methyltransferase [Chloroflexota bacterium]